MVAFVVPNTALWKRFRRAGVGAVMIALAAGGLTRAGFIDFGREHLGVFAATAAAARSPRPATTVRKLSCEKLADIPGKSVTTALVTFPPRAYTPAHRHPGAVTAFVVKGTIRSQMAGGAAHDYAAGTTWFEPARALHLFAENPSSTAPAELLAVFVTDEDCGPLVVPEPTK